MTEQTVKRYDGQATMAGTSIPVGFKAGMVSGQDYDALQSRLDAVQRERDLIVGKVRSLLLDVAERDALLRDIFCTCNLREMPSEHAIRDISNRIDALLSASAEPAKGFPARDSNCSSSGNNQHCRHDMRGCWWDESGKTITGQECTKCGYCLTDVEPAHAGDGEVQS